MVLDVGAGDGLIGFDALERVGDEGQVVFSEVSPTLVDRCREIAEAAGALDQLRVALEG